MDIGVDDIFPFLDDQLRKLFESAEKDWHKLSHFLGVEREEAVRVLGLSEEQYQQIIGRIDESATVCEINAGEFLMQNEKKFISLSTGFPQLDSLLNKRCKGFTAGQIYEICGPPDSGKTMFCQNFAAHIALIFKKNVLFIDTKGDFYGSSVMEFLLRNAPEDVTDDVEKDIFDSASERIRVCSAPFPNMVIRLLCLIYDKMKGRVPYEDVQESTFFENLDCIILDNIATVTAFEVADEQPDHGGETLRIGAMLHKLADIFIIPIIVVNQASDIQAELHLSLSEKIGTESEDFKEEAMETSEASSTSGGSASSKVQPVRPVESVDMDKFASNSRQGQFSCGENYDSMVTKLYFTEAGKIWDSIPHHRLDFTADRERKVTKVTMKKSAFRPCGSFCEIKIME